MASQTPPATQATASSTERPAVSTWNPNNDPAKTGYDPTKRWANYFNILLGKMNREGQEAFREDAYIRNEARDCSNCDKWRDYLFEYSPTIRFMSKNIMDLNGKLDRSNVQCRRCPTRRVIGEDGKEQTVRQGGGFSPDHGILICANEMRNQGHLEDTLAHEMVHAWDHLRWKVDWSDLRHAACTEVRGLTGQLWYCANNPVDSSIQPERRVQVDQRVLREEQLHAHTTTPELRQEQGHSVRHEPPKLQGRCTCHQGGERSLGLMFCGYPAIRRDLPVV